MADTPLLPSPAQLAPLTNSPSQPNSPNPLSPLDAASSALSPVSAIHVEHEDGSKTIHIPAPISKVASPPSVPPASEVSPNPAIMKPAETGANSVEPRQPAKPLSGASADSSSNGVSNTSAGGEQSLGAPTELKPLPQFDPSSAAPPSLAPQGGGNKLFRLLSRVTGVTAETPKPGQPYTGPTDTAGKVKAGAKFAQAIGLGLTAAAGRPEESELAMQMPMKQRQMELETSALKNEAAYRSGMLTNNANKNVIAEQKNVGNMRAKGYVQNEAAPGEYRPMTPEEIAADPSLSLSFETKKAAQDASNAKADYQRTLSYYQAHPNAQVQAQLEIANKRLQSTMLMFHARFGLEQSRLSMQGTESMYQFGRNALTGEDLDASNAPPGMLTNPVSGAPVPTRMQSVFAPTGQQKTSAGRASVMLNAIPPTLSTLDGMRDELGPYMGRWNEFMQGKLGADDPAFASLRMNLSLISSGVTLAHSLGRMPSELFDEFSRQINAPQQSPDNLISVLKTVTPYLQQIQQVGAPKAISPVHKAASSGGASEIEYVRNAQGKLVKKGQ